MVPTVVGGVYVPQQMNPVPMDEQSAALLHAIMIAPLSGVAPLELPPPSSVVAPLLLPASSLLFVAGAGLLLELHATAVATEPVRATKIHALFIFGASNNLGVASCPGFEQSFRLLSVPFEQSVTTPQTSDGLP
jgi:hypothetical protein